MKPHMSWAAEWRDIPTQELREAIAAGAVSATTVCEAALACIERREPELHAMTDVTTAAALKDAGCVDSLPAGQARGALAGVPVAVKSNIETAGAVCDAGLPQLEGRRATQDAEVVARLRRAGAVILGTTQTDSGGFGVTTPAVINPLLPDRVAGGSSGGSAVAVAAGYCRAALGTDTGGSVRIPAACCGIVGFKPTHARLSTEGVRPLVASIDHVGVLGRSVRDVVAVMRALDAGNFAGLGPAHNPVLGIAADYVNDADAEVAAAFGEFVATLADAGCTVRHIALPSPDDTLDSHLVLALTEAAQAEAKSRPGMPAAAQESLAAGSAYGPAAYELAIARKAAFASHIGLAFGQVDAIVLPTLCCLPPKRSAAVVHRHGRDVAVLEALIRYTSPFNQSGHPALAIPWRARGGTAMTSIQLVAPKGKDEWLLALGQVLEDLESV